MSLHLPIRTRLTLAFALSTAILLAVAGTFLFFRLQAQLRSATNASLRSQVDVLVSGMDQDGTAFGDTLGPGTQQGQTYAQILTSTGHVQESSEPVAASPLLSATQIAQVTGPTYFEQRVPGVEGVSRLYAVPVVQPQGKFIVVAGVSLNSREEILSHFLLFLMVGGPAVLALASCAGWLIAGTALRPVERMRREAEAISVSDRGRRLPVPSSGDEIEKLGITLNSMLDRLQNSFDRERRLVDDASHELRTPLSILKTELDIALSRSRSAAEMETALRSASEEADRLASLAEDLLVYSTLDQGRLDVRRRRTRIDELLREARDAHARRGAELGVFTEIVAPRASMSLDPIRVRQALDNLIENALRHAQPGDVIRLSASVQADELTISVSDTGSGFDDEMLALAFEPFARGTADRATPAPGAGLGLPIVQAVARAHGGEARLMNQPGGGALVELTIHGEVRLDADAPRPVAR